MNSTNTNTIAATDASQFKGLGEARADTPGGRVIPTRKADAVIHVFATVRGFHRKAGVKTPTVRIFGSAGEVVDLLLPASLEADFPISPAPLKERNSDAGGRSCDASAGGDASPGNKVGGAGDSPERAHHAPKSKTTTAAPVGDTGAIPGTGAPSPDDGPQGHGFDNARFTSPGKNTGGGPVEAVNAPAGLNSCAAHSASGAPPSPATPLAGAVCNRPGQPGHSAGNAPAESSFTGSKN